MTDLRRIDINLLVVLDALLTERHLTRAGERIGMTQPAVSGALSRLRQLYADQLLVRVGSAFELTPKAQELQPVVRRAITEVNRTLDLTPTFDPRTSTRTFMISASDYVLALLTSPLLAAFAQEAPGATVEFDGLPSGDEVTPVDLLRWDVIIAGAGRGVPGKQQRLFSDRFVTIVDERNPRLRDGQLTLADLNEMSHVRSILGGQELTIVDVVLAAAGVRARAAIAVQGFLAVPILVRGTDMVGHVPERVARWYERAGGLVIAQTPLEIPTLVEVAHWHPSKSRDPALVWLLRILRTAAKTVQFATT